jgi:hypothetical protein
MEKEGGKNTRHYRKIGCKMILLGNKARKITEKCSNLTNMKMLGEKTGRSTEKSAVKPDFWG